MSEFRAEFKGLDRLLKKTDPAIINGPLRTFLTTAAIHVESLGKERAPVETGRLRSSITHRVDTNVPPLWARVGTNVTSRGVSYPRILEESARHHYRATVHRGQPTFKWLSGSLVKAQDRIEGFLRTMTREVERLWSR